MGVAGINRTGRPVMCFNGSQVMVGEGMNDFENEEGRWRLEDLKIIRDGSLTSSNDTCLRARRKYRDDRRGSLVGLLGVFVSNPSPSTTRGLVFVPKTRPLIIQRCKMPPVGMSYAHDGAEQQRAGAWRGRR